MLTDQLEQDIKDALKAKDTTRVGTLRFLMSKIQNKEIEKRHQALLDEEVLAIISTLVKKAEESIDLFAKGGREDLVKSEKAQQDILKQYLPTQLSDEEMENIVRSTIEELKANTLKDMGRVMSAVMEKVRNQVDGKKVSALVQKLLS